MQAFNAHGFRAPCAWYLNDDANIAYARKAPNGGRLSLPLLFVNGNYDQVNSINGNRLGEPMRAACSDLTVTSLPGAHWRRWNARRSLSAPSKPGCGTKKLSGTTPDG